MKHSILLFTGIALVFIGIQCSSKNGNVTINPGGIDLETKNFNLRVLFYDDNMVRVLKWLPGTKPDTSSLIVILKSPPDLKIGVKQNSESIALSSEKLKVIISKSDGHVEYFTPDNKPFLKENGLADIKPADLKNEKAYSIKQEFELSADEGIYGLGQHQYGYMNYRGHTIKLVQTNTDAVSPFLVSTKNYGILWDNYSKTIFDDNVNGTSIWSDVANGIDYYFISGNKMDDVITGYRKLTGQAPMYGKWAYGYWQSKEHYKNRNELLDVAHKYRKLHIPIDNIIQDWDYWDGNKNWGQLFFDEKLYPDPKEMIDILHRQNFHLMISIWCSFGPNTPVFKEMNQRGFLYPSVGWAKFKYFDAYNPAADNLFWKYISKGLFSTGLDGWWMDSTEPDIINANTKESTEYELKRMADNHIGSFARYLNPYSLLATEAVYKNQRSETDKKRVYILTRSTFAGQQRAAATTWSGDIGASWDIYKKQVPAGLNHCMSGIPYWTFDIGAFVLGSYGGVFSKGGKDPAYQELYTRMFQFGSFCPIFRSHGSETPREIWEFGDFSKSLIKFDNLRYRLMPYIYSLASSVTNNGYTIMRGLPMDFPGDKNTYSIDDQYMFGPAIMVCPVTDYMLHRPPESSVPVSSGYFRTDDGKPGLNAWYYKDTENKNLTLEKIDSCININWYATGRPDYVTDSTLSIKWKGKLIPPQTGQYQFHIKCYGPKRIFIDRKELPYVYQSVESYTGLINLEARKEYDFAMETENETTGALRVELFWKTPEIFAREQIFEKREESRKVYLPAGSKWYDFWTGEIFNGGQTITSDAPIDKIPLLIKAGSIIPMGPFVQYANEKPADPLEIRIYPGADGEFTLYEDESDNYNYEKGISSVITFRWDDATHRLTIGKHEGSFPGMIVKRSFQITLVGKSKGTDIEINKTPDKTLQYKGEEYVVQM
ncbi:MAG: TIM-barrel domain-containing protein [Bacteroidales bacterium]